MLNSTMGYKNTPLFDQSAEPTAATPPNLLPSANSDAGEAEPESQPSNTVKSINLITAADRKSLAKVADETRIPDRDLEGFSDDPGSTKVVDRRWYERNKHIYPASMWEDFDPKKDYTTGTRKDGEGNVFFFSR